ncbi:hypothetical protein PG993_009142 [Apiospora rasikravindrae]|uniref:Uncharacterized protein n=1 Tax=Apiospora rasikravindrae TaxID=990691 RepID=A0ABR1SJ10_9PEZI
MPQRQRAWFAGAYSLYLNVSDDNACYPCIHTWAYTHKPSAHVKPTFGCCFMGAKASACASDDPDYGCLGKGKTCESAPGLLRGDSILFSTMFMQVSKDFFAQNDDGVFEVLPAIRLEVVKILVALARAFVRLVETHKAEFRIDGNPKDNVEAMGSYRSTILARETTMKASFKPLTYNATVEEKSAFDKACTLRLQHYDRGYTA